MEATRKRAGTALAAFLVMMVVLTLLSRTLQEMVVPVVTLTTAQRGSLEHRVNADGTLSAANIVPVNGVGEPRIVEVIAKVGQTVSEGDALLRLDYTDVMTERYSALMEALDNVSECEQTLDWATADVSTDSVDTLESRRASLSKAEAKRDEAQKALDDLVASDAPESDQKRARSKLKTAQDNVNYYKRRLEQLTSIRDYMKAEKALVAAERALDDAWNAYFEVYQQLDSALAVNQQQLREDALMRLRYGGSAQELISFDPRAPHPGTLRAPVAGEILTTDAKEGEQLKTSAPAFTLGDASGGYLLTVTVSSDESERMKVGDAADVTIGSDRVSCAITSIRASETDSGRYDVTLKIPAGYGSSGLRGSMRYSIKSASYDLLVPLSALHEDSQGSYVYIVEQSTGSLGSSRHVRRVDVYELDSDATRAALQGGVSQRDMLVLRGDRELSDGDRVRLSEED